MQSYAIIFALFFNLLLLKQFYFQTLFDYKNLKYAMLRLRYLDDVSTTNMAAWMHQQLLTV